MPKQLAENSTIQHKSLKLRIYPNQEQKVLINQTFGCCRKLYNEHLQERNEFYIENILPVKNKITEKEKKEIYKTFKPKTEKEWKLVYPYMKEVSSTSLQQARMDCDQAFMNFFKSKNGCRKGKSGFPKFKSKKNNHQSYRESSVNENCKCLFENRIVKIPKLGKVSFKDRQFPKWWNQIQKLCSMTVSKSCSGNYYVSILFEISPCNYKVENRKEATGLDFSPSEMYVSSENQTGKDFGYVAQKQKHHKQLKRLERRLARKEDLFKEFLECALGGIHCIGFDKNDKESIHVFNMKETDIMLGKTPAKSYEWTDKEGKPVAKFHTFDWWDGKNIEDLEVSNQYKGRGYSYQLLDYATKELGARNLAVDKTNTIAKHVYDKYGFKIVDQDDTRLYMKLEKKVVT